MSLVERDLKVIWHPYTQMQTALPPIPIVRGEGACVYDENGKKRFEMHYHMGEKTGTWSNWNENGELVSAKDYAQTN